MGLPDDVFNKTMDNEGRRYENIPGDPGGPTFWGISRIFNPTWAGWALIDSYGPDFDLLPGLVQVFYDETNWTKNLLGQFINPKLAGQMFDAIVNMEHAAIKGLQNLVGVEPDGGLGPFTLKAVNEQDQDELAQNFVEWRANWYRAEVEKNPAKAEFLDGWLKRCAL